MKKSLMSLSAFILVFMICISLTNAGGSIICRVCASEPNNGGCARALDGSDRCINDWDGPACCQTVSVELPN
jgi:hypothetical protein